MRKLSINEIKERIQKIHYGNVSIVEESYVNTTTLAIFIDIEYGEWSAKPYKILSGQSHPKRRIGKIKKTCFNRYGVDNPLKCKEVLEKIKKTCKEKYGVENPFQNERIKDKIRETNIKNLGVDHPSKNINSRIKAARSCNQITDLIHWKTNDIVPCRGSWEVKVVQYLNINKVDFSFQYKTFLMPDGRTYTPDVYLINEDKWIEIKGYFWDDSGKKWNWFHKNYPNSELWDKQKLKELKIL